MTDEVFVIDDSDVVPPDFIPIKDEDEPSDDVETPDDPDET